MNGLFVASLLSRRPKYKYGSRTRESTYKNCFTLGYGVMSNVKTADFLLLGKCLRPYTVIILSSWHQHQFFLNTDTSVMPLGFIALEEACVKSGQQHVEQKSFVTRNSCSLIPLSDASSHMVFHIPLLQCGLKVLQLLQIWFWYVNEIRMLAN
jgi:hypothetical protein